MSITQCNYWYFPIVLPAIALLLQSLHAQESPYSLPCIDDVLDEILSLCHCAPGGNKATWLEVSKANILAVGTLHQQNLSNSQPLCPSQQNIASNCFFELVANSVAMSIKQSFASLQHTLQEGHVWRSYNCLHYQLSTVTSLVVYCVIPLCKNLLASTGGALVAAGVHLLVRACCASPPALLTNTRVLQLSQCPEQALHAVLKPHPPLRSGCFCSNPRLRFNHIILSFRELFSVVGSLIGAHTAALTSVPAGSQSLDVHVGGLIECFNTAIKIVK